MVDTLTADLDLEPPFEDIVDDESPLYVGSDTPEGEGRIFTDIPPGVGVAVGDDVVSQTGEEVVAQVTPKETAPMSSLEIARDMHRSLISNESWRKENPGAVEWSTFQKMLEDGDVSPEEAIAEFAEQHNKGLRIDQLFHSLYWSTPENLNITEGISRRRAATLETLYQIAENSGIPLSYVDKRLGEGNSPDALIAEFTGAEDVENIIDTLVRAGKDAGRLLVEGGPGAWAAMQAAGATFKATTPLRTTPWGTAASIGLSGAAGIGTYLLGQSFMTTPLLSFDAPSEMLLGKKPQVTPRALPARAAGETAGTMFLLAKPSQTALAKIPEQIGVGRIITNLDRMNMNVWGRIKSYLFPGFKRTTQNIAESMGYHARRRAKIPFTGGKLTAAGVPMNLSDVVIGTSMGWGAGIAEQIDPGDLMTRFTWEMGMGIVNPLRLTLKLLKAVGPGAWSAARAGGRSVAGRTPDAGEMQKGYNWLVNYAEQLGYSEAQILKRIDQGILRDPSGKEVPLTLAQRTGIAPFTFLTRSLRGEKISPAVRARLSALGIKQADGGPTLEAVVKDGEDAGLAALVEFMDILRREGTSDGLQKAAIIERAIIEDVFQTSIENRINRAAEAASRLGPREGAPSVMQSGEKVYEVIAAALQDARAMEKRLYGEAGSALQGEVEATNVVSAWERLTADPYETGVGIIPEFLEKMEGVPLVRRWLRRRMETPESEDLTEGLKLAQDRIKKETALIDKLDRQVTDLSGGAATREVRESVETYHAGYWTKYEGPDALRQKDPAVTEIFDTYGFTPDGIERAIAHRVGQGEARAESTLTVSPSEARAIGEGAPDSTSLLNEKLLRDDMISQLLSVEDRYSAPLRESSRDYRMRIARDERGGDGGVFIPGAGEKLTPNARKDVVRLAKAIRQRLQANQELVAARERLAALKDEQGVAVSESGPLISNVGELNSFRGSMLELAREASAAGRFNEARLYSELAAAALDDIGVKTDVVGPLEDAGLEAIRHAHNYSRTLNDYFSRMFAAQVLEKTTAGGTRKSPELLAQEMISSKSDPTALKMQQLFDAVTFVGESGEAAAISRSQTLAGAYNDILQDYSQKVLRPIRDAEGIQLTGPDGEGLFAVDPEARRKFLETYRPILEINGLEDLTNLLKEDLGGITIQAIKALSNRKGTYYKGLEDQAKYAEFYNNTLRGQTGDISDTRSPTQAIAEAWASPNPAQSLRRLAKNVQEGHIRIAGDGPWPTIQTLDAETHAAVKNGFLQAVFDVGWNKASKGPNGTLDMNLLETFWFKPLTTKSRLYGGKESAIRILNDAKIIDSKYVARFRKLVRDWRQLQETSQNVGELEAAMMKGPSAVQELGLSLLGSTVGSEVASTVGKGTLIFQARAASFARDVIGKTPKLMVKRAVTDLLADPELFKMMSRKGLLPPSHVNRISRFFTSLLGATMSPAIMDQYRRDYEMEMNRRRIEAAKEQGASPEQLNRLRLMYPEQKDILRYTPPQPPPVSISSATQAAPPPVQMAAAPPVQPAPAAAPPGGLAYQDLFRGDMISPLLEARQDRQQRQQLAATQGIGSLA